MIFCYRNNVNCDSATSLAVMQDSDVTRAIPSSVASLSYLRELIFRHLPNQVGPIPSSISNLTRLASPRVSLPAYLRLSHNNLSGEIPKAYANVGFVLIDLSRNRLTRDGSVFFGRSKPAQQIDLSRNLLEFDLSGVKVPTKELILVDLSHNLIRGRIPKGIAQVGNLQFFNASYNRLCGEIPTGGNMERFDEYCYQHNKCPCGTPLPPCK